MEPRNPRCCWDILGICVCYLFIYFHSAVSVDSHTSNRQTFKEINETLIAGNVLTRNGNQVVLCPVSCTLFLESSSCKDGVKNWNIWNRGACVPVTGKSDGVEEFYSFGTWHERKHREAAAGAMHLCLAGCFHIFMPTWLPSASPLLNSFTVSQPLVFLLRVCLQV